MWCPDPCDPCANLCRSCPDPCDPCKISCDPCKPLKIKCLDPCNPCKIRCPPLCNPCKPTRFKCPDPCDPCGLACCPPISCNPCKPIKISCPDPCDPCGLCSPPVLCNPCKPIKIKCPDPCDPCGHLCCPPVSCNPCKPIKISCPDPCDPCGLVCCPPISCNPCKTIKISCPDPCDPCKRICPTPIFCNDLCKPKPCKSPCIRPCPKPCRGRFTVRDPCCQCHQCCCDTCTVASTPCNPFCSKPATARLNQIPHNIGRTGQACFDKLPCNMWKPKRQQTISSGISWVRVTDVHPRGKFVKLTNTSCNNSENIGEHYLIQQQFGGCPLCIFKFPSKVSVCPQGTLRVWASCTDPDTCKQPTDFVFKQLLKWADAADITTLLCRPDGQAIAWYSGSELPCKDSGSTAPPPWLNCAKNNAATTKCC